MGYERTHLFPQKSSHTPQPTSQFSSRPFEAPVQRKQSEQMTPDELENEAFNQQKFEAFGLQLKEKNGTITPVEQERLGVLQTKMDDFWAQRRERASRFGYDFSKVSFTPREGQAAPQLQPMWRQGTLGMPMKGERSPLNSPQQSSASPIQRQLTIGQPGDKYEQEADRVASQVVEQINAPATAQSTQGQSVQRQEKQEGEEVQAKPEITAIQRQEEKPEELQAKSTLKSGEEIAGGEASTDLDTAINSARGGGQPLDAGLQRSMGQAMGADFSGVRVHTDAQSDQLNQSIQAKAFTTGQDMFFRQGAYDPGSRGGQELIAHELTHVVQQNAEDANRKLNLGKSGANPVVQRKFMTARSTGKAHLRDENNWETHKGPAIPANADLLVDDQNAKVQERKVLKNVEWRPAISLPPSHLGSVPDNRKGYIRSSKAKITGELEVQLKEQIQRYLQMAEAKQPYLAGHLDKPDHIEFLLKKALRYESWGSSQLDSFAEAFGTLNDKFTRIQQGANYVAEVLAHWKDWLYREDPAAVQIQEVKLVESDLHERGLGVVEVRFVKPNGGSNQQFKTQTNVHAFIKPENKSLEEALLGADHNSAANEINRIAGLTQPDEQIQTIKMKSTDNYGTFVEAAKGISAENLWKGIKNTSDKPIAQSFHETLIFAYLAGIDDLHKKNVFWDNADVAGVPTLVDADNVLSRNQMENVDNGKYLQSGFGGSFNNAEAKKNKEAIEKKDNSEINSKILNVMLTDQEKRHQIIDALKSAIQGKNGRVVPIRTNFWGQNLKNYPIMSTAQKNQALDRWATRAFLVRELAVDGTGFTPDVGPGLFGVAGKNAGSPFWDGTAERAQTKQDYDSGVIPFYEYDFDTGHVTHNGTEIYHGQTLDQAMTAMLNRFGG